MVADFPEQVGADADAEKITDNVRPRPWAGTLFLVSKNHATQITRGIKRWLYGGEVDEKGLTAVEGVAEQGEG